MSDSPSAVRVQSVVFLGDSITARGDWAAWFPERDAHNLGVGSDTTDEVIARMDAVVDLQPDAVALLIGTNDLGMRRSVEHLVRNVEYLLANLRRDLPGTRTLVQSIMPRMPEFAEQIHDANRHLRQFSPTVHAQYLDLWPALAIDDEQINPQFSDDGLHLNQAGYAAWLGELRPAMERLEEAAPMSSPTGIIREQ
jgi:lysophospholipase L1-like esterase